MKGIETIAKVFAGVGALNWGLQEFVKINVLDYVPTGMIKTAAIAVIAVSGGAVLFWVYKKKI